MRLSQGSTFDFLIGESRIQSKNQMSSQTLKRDHEKYICDALLKTLEINAAFLRMGNDRDEPDVIYGIGSKTVGIEVGTAYYDESDAKQEWTLARGERTFPSEGFEPRARGVIQGPDDLICRKIQHELDDKCTKRYVGTDEVWLCVEQRAPLSDAKSVAQCLQQLTIPEHPGFTRLLLFYLAPTHDGGKYVAVPIA
jgi:hypothetical protein